MGGRAVVQVNAVAVVISMCVCVFCFCCGMRARQNLSTPRFQFQSN